MTTAITHEGHFDWFVTKPHYVTLVIIHLNLENTFGRMANCLPNLPCSDVF